MACTKVIIVEDEPVLQMLWEDVITDAGLEHAGSAHSVADAIELVNSADFDFAVLDYRIVGGDSTPIAELLVARGAPFVICTGNDTDLPGAYEEGILLMKPFLFTEAQELLERLDTMIQSKKG